MLDLKKYRPIEVDDLVRAGKIFDGGYVLSKRQIEGTGILLSFGINADWSFEEDFEKIHGNGVVIYAYDYSIKDSYFVSSSVKNFGDHFLKMLIWLVFGRLKKAKDHFIYISQRGKFKKFFNNSGKHHYIPKFVGQYDNEMYVSFGAIFKDLTADNLSVFLKIDIEGSEYKCLQDIEPYLDKINGMAIEFHLLDICDDKFEKLMHMITKEFYILHIHGNNASELVYKTNIPAVLEITFINRKMILGEVTPSRKSYPVNGLDYPCDPDKEDCVLTFD